jgi:3-methyladenine DNA glycosylase AlkD
MTIEHVIKIMEAHRKPGQADPMEKYMKNHFPFLGIKTPERKTLTKELFKQTKILKEPFSQEFIISLWELPEREYQYIALDYIFKLTKQLNKEHIKLMETLLITKSWWDTVDMLAQHPVGQIATCNKEVIPDVIDDWSISENMWLRRTAILFQLRYKESTDEELLYRYIVTNADSKEFFIQKAIGWALREYSKTNPKSVKQFISNHILANLSIREGSKYL